MIDRIDLMQTPDDLYAKYRLWRSQWAKHTPERAPITWEAFQAGAAAVSATLPRSIFAREPGEESDRTVLEYYGMKGRGLSHNEMVLFASLARHPEGRATATLERDIWREGVPCPASLRTLITLLRRKLDGTNLCLGQQWTGTYRIHRIPDGEPCIALRRGPGKPDSKRYLPLCLRGAE